MHEYVVAARWRCEGERSLSGGRRWASGGAGGIGALINGGAGDAPVASMQTAQGGVGQPASDPMNLWSCAVGNGGGQSGNNGGIGTLGDGAKGDAFLGTIDKNGYAGA